MENVKTFWYCKPVGTKGNYKLTQIDITGDMLQYVLQEDLLLFDSAKECIDYWREQGLWGDGILDKRLKEIGG